MDSLCNTCKYFLFPVWVNVDGRDVNGLTPPSEGSHFSLLKSMATAEILHLRGGIALTLLKITAVPSIAFQRGCSGVGSATPPHSTLAFLGQFYLFSLGFAFVFFFFQRGSNNNIKTLPFTAKINM